MRTLKKNHSVFIGRWLYNKMTARRGIPVSVSDKNQIKLKFIFTKSTSERVILPWYQPFIYLHLNTYIKRMKLAFHHPYLSCTGSIRVRLYGISSGMINHTLVFKHSVYFAQCSLSLSLYLCALRMLI